MKHEIEIEGLPEGWRAVEFRPPKNKESYFTPDGNIISANHDYSLSHLIVEKIKPRRIVLEETEEDANCELPQPLTDGSYIGVMVYAHKIWRVVEEGE